MRVLCIASKFTRDIWLETALKRFPLVDAYYTYNFEQARAIIKEGNIDKIIFAFSATNCATSSSGGLNCEEAVKIFNKITTIPTYVVSAFEVKKPLAPHVKVIFAPCKIETFQEIVQL
jgi:hypothetical protein